MNEPDWAALRAAIERAEREVERASKQKTAAINAAARARNALHDARFQWWVHLGERTDQPWPWDLGGDRHE